MLIAEAAAMILSSINIDIASRNLSRGITKKVKSNKDIYPGPGIGRPRFKYQSKTGDLRPLSSS